MPGQGPLPAVHSLMISSGSTADAAAGGSGACSPLSQGAQVNLSGATARTPAEANGPGDGHPPGSPTHPASSHASALDPLLLLESRLACTLLDESLPAGAFPDGGCFPPAVLDACTEPPRCIPLLQLLCAAEALAERMRDALAARGGGDAGPSLCRGRPAVPATEMVTPPVGVAAAAVRPEDEEEDETDPVFVGVLVGEGPMLVIAPVAALLCGYAFVLLDPCTPRERLRFQLDDTRARLLIVPLGDGDGARHVVDREEGAGDDGLRSFTDDVRGGGEGFSAGAGIHGAGAGVHGAEAGVHGAGVGVHGAGAGIDICERRCEYITLEVSADRLLDEAGQLLRGRVQPQTGGGSGGGCDSTGGGREGPDGSRFGPAAPSHPTPAGPASTAPSPATPSPATCTAALAARLRARLVASSRPSRLAYICYTSGSTGRPKGCAVPRRALGAYATANGRAHDVRQGDRVLLASGVAFDPVRAFLLGRVEVGFVLVGRIGRGGGRSQAEGKKGRRTSGSAVAHEVARSVWARVGRRGSRRSWARGRGRDVV